MNTVKAQADTEKTVSFTAEAIKSPLRWTGRGRCSCQDSSQPPSAVSQPHLLVAVLRGSWPLYARSWARTHLYGYQSASGSFPRTSHTARRRGLGHIGNGRRWRNH